MLCVLVPWSSLTSIHATGRFLHLPACNILQSYQKGKNKASKQLTLNHAEPTTGIPNTVDGRNPANQVRLVVYPIIYKVLYIPGGAGFQPSTVSSILLSPWVGCAEALLHPGWQFWGETASVNLRALRKCNIHICKMKRTCLYIICGINI